MQLRIGYKYNPVVLLGVTALWIIKCTSLPRLFYKHKVIIKWSDKDSFRTVHT